MADVPAGAPTLRQPSFAGMLAAPHQAVALVLGLGLSRFWPGTAGTLGGFVLFIALQPAPLPVRAGLYVLLIALAVWACRRTCEDLGQHDHRSIVIDETIGMSLVLEFAAPGVGAWIAAFLLFRAFDVLKPWPANLADRSRAGGFPVMADDLIAALYAGLALRFGVAPLFGWA